jgi:hypothetical protein
MPLFTDTPALPQLRILSILPVTACFKIERRIDVPQRASPAIESWPELNLDIARIDKLLPSENASIDESAASRYRPIVPDIRNDSEDPKDNVSSILMEDWRVSNRKSPHTEALQHKPAIFRRLSCDPTAANASKEDTDPICVARMERLEPIDM